jgi:hypothetical protein
MIYKLYKDESNVSMYESAYLESVYEEVRKDLFLNNKFVKEQFKGGFKVVAKNGMLFWLTRTVQEDDSFVMYRDEDGEEWYRIEKTKES